MFLNNKNPQPLPEAMRLTVEFTLTDENLIESGAGGISAVFDSAAEGIALLCLQGMKDELTGVGAADEMTIEQGDPFNLRITMKFIPA